jgi:hypothetical protein
VTFRKEDTMRFLFSEQKMFNIDGIYNSQNHQEWVADSQHVNREDGIRQWWKLPKKWMVWLGVCSKGITPLLLLEKWTVDHARHIKEVLSVTVKYENRMFGNGWTFQQDGAKPHTYVKSQTLCEEHLPWFIGKDRWPPNSPDLNPLDYCLWNELGQAIEWHTVTPKTTLISALGWAVRKIPLDVVFESCASWTNRLYRMSQDNGKYLRK